jgi:hypothetical protein
MGIISIDDANYMYFQNHMITIRVWRTTNLVTMDVSNTLHKQAISIAIGCLCNLLWPGLLFTNGDHMILKVHAIYVIYWNYSYNVLQLFLMYCTIISISSYIYCDYVFVFSFLSIKKFMSHHLNILLTCDFFFFHRTALMNFCQSK